MSLHAFQTLIAIRCFLVQNGYSGARVQSSQRSLELRPLLDTGVI